MNEEYKNCIRCKFFERYYTLGEKRLDKTKRGLCCKKKEVVLATDGCDNFVAPPYRRKARYSLNLNLIKLLDEIAKIIKVMEAEKDED